MNGSKVSARAPSHCTAISQNTGSCPCPLIAEALSRIAVSFKRAHATFEFDQLFRAREVFIPAVSFDTLEATDVLEKEDEVNDNA
jgi:hypothetical protein